VPTVLVGHSLSGHAILTCRDEELGKHCARVAVTPLVPTAANRRMLHLMSLAFRAAQRQRAGWRVLVAAYLRQIRASEHVEDAVIDRTREELMQPGTALLGARAFLQLRQSRMQVGGHDRCVVMWGERDPLLPRRLVPSVMKALAVPDRNLRWIAAGGHYPFFDNVRAPEATARNRDEIVRTIGEALHEACQPTFQPTLQLTPPFG
jgi:hypothetical protein